MLSLAGFESFLWHVPVTIATGNSPTAKTVILSKRCDTVTVEGVGPDDWILVRNKPNMCNTNNTYS